MKEMKTIVYALMVLLVFSCNTNDDLLEVENAKTENELHYSAKGLNELDAPPLVYNFSVLVEYRKGTSEIKKNHLRNSVSTQSIYFSWAVCSNNPDAEIWTLSSYTSLAGTAGDADDDPDMIKFEENSLCD